MPPAGGSSRFRNRKLNTKTHLEVLRESDLFGEPQVDATDAEGHDGQAHVRDVKTGVDEVEEKEEHLQAIIKASKVGKLAAAIPTPAAQRGNVPTEDLYQHGVFTMPATYVRFSSTVEDCIGTPYCMDERDDDFLQSINAKVEDGRKKCSEDHFEAVMHAFEETSQNRQPFASVDNTPVLPLNEMVLAFDDLEMDELDDVARSFADDIYQYWKERKVEMSSRTLMPRLKTLNMDQPSKDADDADPYVCFRRREVKSMRRTRRTDNQVIERLKKLRRELEEGRALLHSVRMREECRRDELRQARQIWEQRAQVRELKRTLNITDDDEELLVNQRTPKRRPQDISLPAAARQVPTMLRQRQDSMLNPPDVEIIHYDTKLRAREEAIASQIESELQKLEKKSVGYVDRTQDVLESIWLPQDELDDAASSQWVSINAREVPIAPQQLPTPPESTVGGEGDAMEEDKPEEEDESRQDEDTVQWATPPDTPPQKSEQPPRMVYRRRLGRGGMMLDMRRLRGRPRKQADAKTEELFRYDVDSGEEDDLEDRLDPKESKMFRLGQHLRNWDRKQPNGQSSSGYSHSRTASLNSNHGVSR